MLSPFAHQGDLLMARRLGVILLTVGLAFGAVAATAGAAGGGGYYKDGFKKLKPVKAPTSCDDQTGISDDEIKVGAIMPTSGPQALSFSSAQDGMKARFAKANDDGELGKRKLALEIADDAGDPARNLTAAQELVEQAGVYGVMTMTSAMAGSAKYLNQQGIPVTGWHVGQGVWGDFDNMFGWRNSQPSDPAEEFTSRQADFMELQGGKNVALVGTNIQSSATFADQIEEAIKKTKKGKLKVVFKTTDLGPADREFTGVAQKIKDAGADTVFTGMDLSQNAPLAEALEQVGADIKVLIVPGGYDSRAPGVYPALEGAYFGIEFIPFESNPAAFATYSEEMQKAGKHFEGQIPYIGWLIADTFIKGLTEAGKKCPTREGFIANLRLVDDWDAGGAFEPVDFSKTFGKIFPCVHYVKIVNAKFELVEDGKFFCAKNVIKNGKVIKVKPSELKGV